MTDLDLYINFAIHAIFGKLGEADTIMRLGGDAVRKIAAELAAELPVATVPIYRGMLLDPEEPFTADPALTFLSWSEDRDVALWFACPRSVVSEPIMQLKPQLRGYVVELPQIQSPVLFHYSWARVLGGLARFALLHPLMGTEGYRQIQWSLQTQREIITAPVADLAPVRSPDLDTSALAMLERRLSPPWVVVEEGIRT